MMRRKLNFLGGECCNPAGTLTECSAESDAQLRDRFDEECPYSLLTRRRSAARSSPRTAARRNCDSQVWRTAVAETVAEKRDTLRRSVSSVFRSMNNLRTGFKVAAQKLRPSTRRRFKLDESPMTPNTPKTRSKCLLGRTPTKMYSPFAIDTPPSLRRRYAYRRNRNLDTESNKSVNGKSECNSSSTLNNENKQPTVNSDKDDTNFGSLI